MSECTWCIGENSPKSQSKLDAFDSNEEKYYEELFA